MAEKGSSANEQTNEPAVRTNKKIVRKNGSQANKGSTRTRLDNSKRGDAFHSNRSRKGRSRTRSPVQASNGVETPGRLTPGMAQAVQRTYKSVGSMEKTAWFHGISKSTVSKYCEGIEPDPGPEPSVEAAERIEQTQTSTVAPTTMTFQVPVQASTANGDDAEPLTEGDEVARMPRLSSEVAARRPVIVDESNGRSDGSHSLNSQIEVRGPFRYDNAGTVQPSFSNQAWETIRLMIHGSAMRDGFSDPLEYFNEVILVDLRTADLVRTLIPHHDVDSLRRNLNTIVRKALAYDKNRQDAGLGETQDPTGKTTDSESEGPAK